MVQLAYSRTSLFQTRLIRNPRCFEAKLIPLRLTVTWCQLGYFKAPLFRTYFHVLWDFEIAGCDCISSTITFSVAPCLSAFIQHFTIVILFSLSSVLSSLLQVRYSSDVTTRRRDRRKRRLEQKIVYLLTLE